MSYARPRLWQDAAEVSDLLKKAIKKSETVVKSVAAGSVALGQAIDPVRGVAVGFDTNLGFRQPSLVNPYTS
ncbi:hypothetical protein KIPB_000594 [Kipferlia bialata]|uniref:Uncharacterized protein n=1 Tax=Kipferlia bialata TaxID=797122 RepID=A0A9K3GDK4_9EUKA|nr:hypothetical protein KIPB_000594 [Kipferlia bialata]|eukprot:g594.t1